MAKGHHRKAAKSPTARQLRSSSAKGASTSECPKAASHSRSLIKNRQTKPATPRKTELKKKNAAGKGPKSSAQWNAGPQDVEPTEAISSIPTKPVAQIYGRQMVKAVPEQIVQNPPRPNDPPALYLKNRDAEKSEEEKIAQQLAEQGVPKIQKHLYLMSHRVHARNGMEPLPPPQVAPITPPEKPSFYTTLQYPLTPKVAEAKGLPYIRPPRRPVQHSKPITAKEPIILEKHSAQKPQLQKKAPTPNQEASTPNEEPLHRKIHAPPSSIAMDAFIYVTSSLDGFQNWIGDQNLNLPPTTTFNDFLKTMNITSGETKRAKPRRKNVAISPEPRSPVVELEAQTEVPQTELTEQIPEDVPPESSTTIPVQKVTVEESVVFIEKPTVEKPKEKVTKLKETVIEPEITTERVEDVLDLMIAAEFSINDRKADELAERFQTSKESIIRTFYQLSFEKRRDHYLDSYLKDLPGTSQSATAQEEEAYQQFLELEIDRISMDDRVEILLAVPTNESDLQQFLDKGYHPEFVQYFRMKNNLPPLESIPMVVKTAETEIIEDAVAQEIEVADEPSQCDPITLQHIQDSIDTVVLQVCGAPRNIPSPVSPMPMEPRAVSPILQNMTPVSIPLPTPTKTAIDNSNQKTHQSEPKQTTSPEQKKKTPEPSKPKKPVGRPRKLTKTINPMTKKNERSIEKSVLRICNKYHSEGSEPLLNLRSTRDRRIRGKRVLSPSPIRTISRKKRKLAASRMVEDDTQSDTRSDTSDISSSPRPFTHRDRRVIASEIVQEKGNGDLTEEAIDNMDGNQSTSLRESNQSQIVRTSLSSMAPHVEVFVPTNSRSVRTQRQSFQATQRQSDPVRINMLEIAKEHTNLFYHHRVWNAATVLLFINKFLLASQYIELAQKLKTENFNGARFAAFLINPSLAKNNSYHRNEIGTIRMYLDKLMCVLEEHKLFIN